MPKKKGNRGTEAILGNREHTKSRFCFWGTRPFFRGNKGTGTPPPHTHTHTHPHTHTSGRATIVYKSGVARCGGNLCKPVTMNLALFAWNSFLFIHSIIGPRQANLVLIAYASSEGSGEPAHPRSLARTFAARS